MIILYVLAGLFVVFCFVLMFSLCKISGHHSRLEEQEEARRAHGCCNGDCNQGRACPVRETRAAQASAGPRSHYRWSLWYWQHAIALAAVAAFGWLFLR
jgi:hypothetical protein